MLDDLILVKKLKQLIINWSLYEKVFDKVELFEDLYLPTRAYYKSSKIPELTVVREYVKFDEPEEYIAVKLENKAALIEILWDRKKNDIEFVYGIQVLKVDEMELIEKLEQVFKNVV